jgi:hypothetical protein
MVSMGASLCSGGVQPAPAIGPAGLLDHALIEVRAVDQLLRRVGVVREHRGADAGRQRALDGGQRRQGDLDALGEALGVGANVNGYPGMTYANFAVIPHYVDGFGRYGEGLITVNGRPDGEGEYIWPACNNKQGFEWFATATLAKRGKVGPKGAPCFFLWKLADGHAQCGLGTLRPRVCLSYPALLVDATALPPSVAPASTVKSRVALRVAPEAMVRTARSSAKAPETLKQKRSDQDHEKAPRGIRKIVTPHGMSHA